ncbi:hypothetical protein ACSBR1_012908 [Camellia fascicularis]
MMNLKLMLLFNKKAKQYQDISFDINMNGGTHYTNDGLRHEMRGHENTRIAFAQRPYSFASRILSYDSQNIVFSPYGDY